MKEYRLTITSGNSIGKAQILNTFPVTLGRSSKNDFSIPDEMLSRHHCSIDMRNDELWLTDLASANGTAVNGKIIDEVRLSAGDIIQIGDTVLKLTEANEGATISAPAPEIKVTPTPIPNIKQQAATLNPNGNIDLGLNSSPSQTEIAEQKKNNIQSIKNLALVAVATIVVVGAAMMFFNPFADHWSTKSAMGLEGVMG